MDSNRTDGPGTGPGTVSAAPGRNPVDAAMPGAATGELARAPSLSLPNGGGAIRGVGEKFAANPVTGTGSLIVPLATSPGRSGFGPQLSLSYDSGAGNGPFGFGWSLGLPAITRKTDKGLPRYQDADESDVFILPGAEDLVPVLDSNSQRVHGPRTVHGVTYDVHSYRPRIEGLFARIERWTTVDTGISHWRSITRDNVTTLYGFDDNSRIAVPTDPRTVFSYRICRTWDDKGNVALYEYVAEDGRGVDHAQAHEANRTDAARAAQRYLKRIRYGNAQPYFPDWLPVGSETPLPASWHFDVVFDYGDHRPDTPLPTADRAWPVRPDPFSAYRAGFEVRTYRRCARVLIFHHFAAEPGVGDNCLVRSTDLLYSDQQTPGDPRNPVYTFLQSVTQIGYRRAGAGYTPKSLPPLEFEYSQPQIQPAVLTLDADSLANLPEGLDGARYQWVDLDGEGLSGILTDFGGGWGYKRNLSPLNQQTLADGSRATRARFGPLEQVAALPSRSDLGSQHYLDLSGDGQRDLVSFADPVPGFFERTPGEDWEPFQPFTALPRLDWSEPNLTFVDLTGDGFADILITENGLFTFYPSLGAAGFGTAEEVRTPRDEERGPKVVLADGTQTIFLADMCGDGLSDLVRIRNGDICYWPNLGYGRFAGKVSMGGAPRFVDEERFDPRRIRLADIDGSGTTDLLYIGDEGVLVCFNRSGNSWAAAHRLAIFPTADSLSAVQVADLLGNGTACLVWSSPLPGAAPAPLRYVDLMGGQKPHLMIRSRNNLGAETRLRYAPSTRFYLADKLAARPWVTRLPFPVHVVERVETYDWIARSRFVTRYAYHHGHFDGYEREFRGFGLVEQWDTEEHRGDTDFPEAEATNWDAASSMPPMLTRTWFHTGAFVRSMAVSRQYAHEYWAEPDMRDDPTLAPAERDARRIQRDAMLLPGTVLPPDLTADEVPEVYRALKGVALRTEVYAGDGSPRAEHPYTVTEQNLAVRRVQPRAGNRHAVFFTHTLESISYHYERNPVDPRVAHALTLEVDGFGNVLKSAAAGYGRRRPDMNLSAEDRAKQTRMLVTYTENQVTNAITGSDEYRTPLAYETRNYELTGYTPTGAAGRFQSTDFVRPDPADPTRLKHIFAAEIKYEDQPTTGQQRRPIEQSRTLYRKDDLTDTLALGLLESRALPLESYKLAFTPGLITAVYGDRITGAMPATEGCYVHSEGDANWWVPSGRVFYSPDPTHAPAQELAHARAHFFLPHRYRDPFHTAALSTETFVVYDTYGLLVQETRDALGNRVTAGERDVDSTQPLVRQGQDYRVLQPALMMDPNRNCSAVAYDALGLVVGTAVMGKPEDNPLRGERLDGFDPELTDAALAAHLQDPLADPNAILGSATTRLLYDLFAYQRTRDRADPQAVVVYTLVRETHDADLDPGRQTKIHHSFSYSDGFGREIQKKIQAEAGPVPLRDPATGRVITVDGRPVITPNDVGPRWVGSGWTVFNNKGKPVRQYEPFFTDSHRFEFDMRIGVSPVLFYDPAERVVASLHPNHTWEKVVFDQWQQQTYDVNDTVTFDPKTDLDVGGFFTRLPDADYLPTWRQQRTGGALGAPEQQAAERAAAHADTPAAAHLDTLGRTFLTFADNGPDPARPGEHLRFATRVLLDIEGNQRAVSDAIGRVAMRYDYDMLGTRIHQASMEAGARWMLNDVMGKPIRAWDSRGFIRRIAYDALHRPLGTFVTENGAVRLETSTAYGEGQGTANNHRTRIFQVFDGAGVVTSEAYDFKGNLLRGRRDLLPDYTQPVDWLQNPLPNDGTFTGSTTYDALNRVTAVTAPDGSVYRPTYNEANLLEAVGVNLRGAAATTPFVTDINYDAKGQRELITYGNGARTRYEYDPLTSRLTRLRTTRPAGLNGLASQLFADAAVVQDLRYTYDPVGNATRIEDAALPIITHNGEQVQPVCSYTYDALYRLIEARGREHIGQAAADFNPAGGNRRDFPFAGGHAHPNDMQAMRNYTEGYEYDAVGNFLFMRHSANGGGWTRGYEYNAASLIEPAQQSNRLTKTTVGNGVTFSETYTYADAQGHDVDGCMTIVNNMKMIWDSKDQLQQVDLSGGGTAYYVYDAGGQRVRKVIETQNGARKQERIYLGGFEVYREYNGGGDTVTLARETLHIMDDKQRIALVETRTQGNDPAPQQLIRYQLGNHLGSASLELDDQAQVISYEEYYPYGSTSYQATRSQAETPKRYRYTGKERDEETGFAYHGARYYAPWLGRWTSPDPQDSPQQHNLYEYVLNNPCRLVDPDGADEKDPQKPGGSFMPPNQSDIGTLVHTVVLKTMSARLQALGLPNATEVETLPHGSKKPTSQQPGSVDLAVFTPDPKVAGEHQAHLYELKPRNPNKYQDYVSEVDHYTEHFPKNVGPLTVSQPKVGTVLDIADKLVPQIFDPITIKNGEFEATINIALAKDNNGTTIPGLIVYDVSARRRRPDEEQNQVQNAKDLLSTKPYQTTGSQIMMEHRLEMFVKIAKNVGFSVGFAGGAIGTSSALSVGAVATTTGVVAPAAATAIAGTGATVTVLGAGTATTEITSLAASILLYFQAKSGNAAKTSN